MRLVNERHLEISSQDAPQDKTKTQAMNFEIMTRARRESAPRGQSPARLDVLGFKARSPHSIMTLASPTNPPGIEPGSNILLAAYHGPMRESRAVPRALRRQVEQLPTLPSNFPAFMIRQPSLAAGITCIERDIDN
jgi:hypothetical protein